MNYKVGYAVIGVITLLMVTNLAPILKGTLHSIKRQIQLQIALRKYMKWRANHLMWIKKTSEKRKSFLTNRFRSHERHSKMKQQSKVINDEEDVGAVY